MKRFLIPILMACMPLLAAAQAYPAKQVRLVVPFAPGGPADALGRIVGEGLSKPWGQTVLVENKVGAAGSIGVGQVAKAAPDGYTLAVVPVGNIAVNPTLMPNLPYKPTDLASVTMLATAENVLVTGSSVPARSLSELLKLAAQKPGQLTFASPGAGSQAHLAGEMLQLDANIKLIHVPYKGISPALTDVVGGQVTMMFAPLSTALPFVKSGKLNALGVASARRSAAMPELPTIAELGFPKFEAVSWYALMAPAGTPPEVVQQISRQTNDVLADPALKEKLAAVGLEVGGGTPRELDATIQKESARWANVIRTRQISVD